MAHTKFSDIVYDAGLGLALDIYQPNAGTNLPCILEIHGGGWYSGDKGASNFSGQSDRGYVVVCVNYRLTTVAPFPAQIHDVKGAVRWIRANAATYNINPAKIAAVGFSAGGHLASLLGTSGGVAALEGTTGGNLGYSSSVQAVVDGFGPAELLSMWASIIGSPVVNGIKTNVEAVQLLCNQDPAKASSEPPKGSQPTKATSEPVKG